MEEHVSCEKPLINKPKEKKVKTYIAKNKKGQWYIHS